MNSEQLRQLFYTFLTRCDSANLPLLDSFEPPHAMSNDFADPTLTGPPSKYALMVRSLAASAASATALSAPPCHAAAVPGIVISSY